jgi:DNA-binding IclR family transcriptional regulator
MHSEWWNDVESDVLRCLEGRDAVPPGEIAQKLGMSEAAATSLLSILASEGKVRIRAFSSEGPAAT